MCRELSQYICLVIVEPASCDVFSISRSNLPVLSRPGNGEVSFLSLTQNRFFSADSSSFITCVSLVAGFSAIVGTVQCGYEENASFLSSDKERSLRAVFSINHIFPRVRLRGTHESHIIFDVSTAIIKTAPTSHATPVALDFGGGVKSSPLRVFCDRISGTARATEGSLKRILGVGYAR